MARIDPKAPPPLFEEWDETDIPDLEQWDLETAAAAQHEAPRSRPKNGRFIDSLDEKLSDDIGYASAEENLDMLARMYVEDKPNYARAEQILRQHKILRLVSQAVRVRARALSNIQVVPGGGEALNLVRVRKEISDAPVHPDAVVPASWILDSGTSGPRRYRLVKRVLKKREGEIYEEQVGVAYNPVVVSASMVDIADGSANLRVSWQARGKWRHKVVRRSKLCQSRELVEALSDSAGFPANANNAKDVIAYLADYEAFNEEVIPAIPMTSQMGWQRKGKLGFVAGRHHVRTSEKDPEVRYVGADTGNEQIAKCVHSVGDFDTWKRAAKIASNFPSVELALYAGLAPALLEPLKAPNFVVDWSGKSSIGKTTTLKVAASLWGNPHVQAADSFITSWDTTAVGIEQRAAALSHLPLCVDETKRAKQTYGQSAVPGIVYEISNGVGRVRGSVKGMRPTLSWRTVMLSTGEQRIFDFDKSGGAVARVVSLWGSPFGGDSRMIGDAILRLNVGLDSNYGHAGPAFARWLLEMIDDWGELRTLYQELAQDYDQKLRAMAGPHAVNLSAMSRVAQYLAILSLTASCAHEALDLPWDLDDPVPKLLSQILPALRSVDREAEALRDVVSWAAANRSRFCRNEKHRKEHEPPGGWLGYWEAADYPNWDKLALFPVALKDFLVKQGYEYSAITRLWGDNGWLLTEKSQPRRAAARVSELGGRPRMVCLTREAVTGAGGLGKEHGQEEIPF